MKTRKQRIAMVAVLFLLPACYGCAVDMRQNGSATLGGCMKLPADQQQPCLDEVSRANQRKLEAESFR